MTNISRLDRSVLGLDRSVLGLDRSVLGDFTKKKIKQAKR
jgi:hypothetical protein